jgi:hypothetical protein
MNGWPQIDAKRITEAVAFGSLDRRQNGGGKSRALSQSKAA